MMDIEQLRKETLAFIAEHRMPNAGTGAYRYSLSVTKPTLYSSAYAVMTRSLYNDLGALRQDERQAWINYFNRHQDSDGLYRDPVIFNQGWYAGDPLTCGRSHQTCHVITALTCLGGATRQTFTFLQPFLDVDKLLSWLEERDWGERVAWTGNEIMNIGTLLQYARDFHNDAVAGDAITVMLEWLTSNHINPDTGVWGDVNIQDPIWRSYAVQAAYHWWPLFFYDSYPIPFMERAIDTVLETQNPIGGFGCGVQNPNEPYKSGACEDIDSIDPLARMSTVTDYRRDDIKRALTKAADWVLQNRMKDGGFVFVLDRPYEYGHPQFYGEKETGAMFPTWFRTLSLAVLGKALPDHFLGRYAWYFVRCPGYQFWTVVNG